MEADRIPSIQAARQYEVLQCRALDVSAGEYSRFNSVMLEIACPVSVQALHEEFVQAKLAGDAAEADLDDLFIGLLGEEASCRLVIRLSSKEGYSYSGTCSQFFITVRAVGFPPQLQNCVNRFLLLLCKAPGADTGGQEHRNDPTGDEVFLVLNRNLSEVGDTQTWGSVQAMAAVVRLIGLRLPGSVKVTCNREPEAEGTASSDWEALVERRALAGNFIRFLSALSTTATWNANEWTYPVPNENQSKWESEEEGYYPSEREIDWKAKAEEEASMIQEVMMQTRVNTFALSANAESTQDPID